MAVFDQPRHHYAAASSGRSSQQQQQQLQEQYDRDGPDRKRRRWDEGKPSDAQSAAATTYGGSSSGRGVSIPDLPSPTRPPSRGGRVGAPSPATCELVTRALTVGFANRIARRMRMHNGYRTCNEKGALAQIHPSSSQLSADDDGLLPEWLIYNEFVATSRPFLRQVRGWRRTLAQWLVACMFSSMHCGSKIHKGPILKCPTQATHSRVTAAYAHAGKVAHISWVHCLSGQQPHSSAAGVPCCFHVMQVCPTRAEWVEPLLPKLQDVDVKRLSGGRLAAQEAAGTAAAAADDGGGAQPGSKKADADQQLARRNDDSAVNAARARYLQRKQAAAATGSKRK